MTERLRHIIRRHCHPLAPLPADQHPVIRELHGVRAVMFDIYGTLLISDSGDIGGCVGSTAEAEAFGAALAAVGLALHGDAASAVRVFRETILQEHEEARGRGVEDPEVDIVEIWRRTLNTLNGQSRLDGEVAAASFEQLSVEYEVRVNPVWPMPGLVECLHDLGRADLTLGLVSNAQFFTPELFPALVGRTVEQLGVDPELQFYSYRHGRGKPGPFLCRLAAKALADRGIRADEAIYLGNDMLNDIAAASAAGFRTALFAGDARSLRRREGDPRVRGVSPEIVITRLSSLPHCLVALQNTALE